MKVWNVSVFYKNLKHFIYLKHSLVLHQRLTQERYIGFQFHKLRLPSLNGHAKTQHTRNPNTLTNLSSAHFCKTLTYIFYMHSRLAAHT